MFGPTAFMAEGYGFSVFDVSDPENPTKISHMYRPGYGPSGIAVSGSTAFMTCMWYGLEILDVSDLENPVIIGDLEIPAYAGNIALSGNTAIVSDGDARLNIIDVGDPENPAIIGSVQIPEIIRSVTVSGNMAFVTYGYGGLGIIDMSNPENPLRIGDLEEQEFFAGDISISGDRAFVSGEELRVLDISDPENLITVSVTDTPGSGRGVTVSGDTAFVADGMSGLVTVPLPIEMDAFKLDRGGSISFVLPALGTPGYYALRVFDENRSAELPKAIYCSPSDDLSEKGHAVTSELSIRAVIRTVEKGPIEAVWKKGGEDETARGDRVIWGHFYASPEHVAWGSPENPDIFVKIWFDVGGRIDVNFFHVSVPDIEVYSEYEGGLGEQDTVTMDRRYLRHYYENGRSGSEEN